MTAHCAGILDSTLQKALRDSAAMCCAEPELLAGIWDAVRDLNRTVIWKLTNQDQAELAHQNLTLPSHVHAVPFLPQNDLLGHDAVAAFVTQGGTNSMYEVSVAGADMTGMHFLLPCRCRSWAALLHEPTRQMIYPAEVLPHGSTSEAHASSEFQ